MVFNSPASPDNEAIRELRDFSKSLETLTEKLALSVEKLSKSAERLEHLTMFLVVFTIILLVIPPDIPLWEKLMGILFILGFAITFIRLKK